MSKQSPAILIILLFACACGPVSSAEFTTVVTLSPAATGVEMTHPTQPAPGSASTETPHLAASPTPAPAVPEATLKRPPGKQAELSQLAMDDLATRLMVNPASIKLVKMYPDEFPASNLGCASETGKLLPIPAIVSGQVIVLEHEQRRYIYHARASEVVYCGEE